MSLDARDCVGPIMQNMQSLAPKQIGVSAAISQ